ncbi:hypothetical protein EVAR_13629_1 [Eumeta japonica]|uniref:Uncharacterized protein n=1 Tax=Eumeta variegata TaxID=151549 RepID=A0A4C1UUP7_EUMVA|nr:hypothetical protein EVAR_13629_1 [Eumeta japonica]
MKVEKSAGYDRASSKMLRGSGDKRAGEPSESRWSPPPMHTRNPRGVINALPASWVGMVYLVEFFRIVEILHRRVSLVRTERRPTTSSSLPEPAMTVEEDDDVSTDNSSVSPTDSGNFKIWTPEMEPSPLDRRGRIPRREDAGA